MHKLPKVKKLNVNELVQVVEKGKKKSIKDASKYWK